MNYRPKFLLYKENPTVPRDLLGQTFLHNLPYFIECGFYFLHCGTCVQGLSKIVVAAKMHALHCWKLLGLLYILPSYLQKGKSLEFNSGEFQKDSNYTWTLTCGTNLSDFFFPVEYSSAIVQPSRQRKWRNMFVTWDTVKIICYKMYISGGFGI